MGHLRYLVFGIFFPGQGRGAAVVSTTENSLWWPGTREVLMLLTLDGSKFVSGKFKMVVLGPHWKGVDK